MSLFKKAKKKTQSETKYGGIAYFASVVSLAILGITSPILAISTLSIGSARSYGICLASLAIGWVLTNFIISPKVSVFIHEFKHSFVSHLVGNKPRGMHLRKDHGHFEYEYYKSTAHHNSTIALAPYWLPIFTIPALGAGYIIFHGSHNLWIGLVALSYGMDLSLGVKDIGPHQSDFTSLRGGYRFALIYLLGMYSTTISFLIIWAGERWNVVIDTIFTAFVK
mgnify:CR=1 FL=1